MGVIHTVIFTAGFVLGMLTAVPYDAIDKAFDNGDAAKIVALGKDKILINIEGKEGAYGNAQAKLVLKSFFEKNPPAGFNFTFKGKESAEGSFAIGNYKSRNGTFRVTIHFMKNSNELKIESMSIEKA